MSMRVYLRATDGRIPSNKLGRDVRRDEDGHHDVYFIEYPDPLLFSRLPAWVHDEHRFLAVVIRQQVLIPLLPGAYTYCEVPPKQKASAEVTPEAIGWTVRILCWSNPNQAVVFLRELLAGEHKPSRPYIGNVPRNGPAAVEQRLTGQLPPVDEAPPAEPSTGGPPPEAL